MLFRNTYEYPDTYSIRTSSIAHHSISSIAVVIIFMIFRKRLVNNIIFYQSIEPDDCCNPIKMANWQMWE